jgi:hypothetical protein
MKILGKIIGLILVAKWFFIDTYKKIETKIIDKRLSKQTDELKKEINAALYQKNTGGSVSLPMFMNKDGNPIKAGYLYVGKPNEKAEENTINLYADKDLTTLVDQPILIENGRLQSGLTLYTTIKYYSISIRDKKGKLIYSSDLTANYFKSITEVIREETKNRFDNITASLFASNALAAANIAQNYNMEESRRMAQAQRNAYQMESNAQAVAAQRQIFGEARQSGLSGLGQQSDISSQSATGGLMSGLFGDVYK